MDNILDPMDPEATDTLAKEWSLPELPAGTSSHPSSSQELAEIFGTSDDEDEEFSFDLNPSLPINNPMSKTAFSDIGLPEVVGGTKSSLLTGPDSGYFLNTIQDSLAGIEQLSGPASGPVSSFDEKGLPPVKGPPSKDKASAVESFGDKKAGEEGGSVGGGGGEDEGVRKLASESTEEGGDEEKKQEGKSGSDGESEPRQLRMSTRLRSRRREEVKNTSLVEATPSTAEGDEKIAEAKKPTDEPPGKADEESTGDGGEGDGGDKSEEMEEGGDEEEEGEGHEEEGEEEEDDEEDDESDDPDHLWCICRQPHDDRFMICCDGCEEWFHGDCVGITVSQGKRMEREGKEYVCPVCLEKAHAAKEQREAGRLARQAKREQLKEKQLKKKLEGHVPPPLSPVKTPTKPAPTKEGKTQRRRVSSSSGHTPSGTEGDQYGLSQLFLPDNAPPEAEGRARMKEELVTTPCQGPGCPEQATAPSIYCGEACIERHAAEMLKLLANRGVSIQTSPSEFVRGSGGVTVTEKATGKTLVGITAPSEKNLVSWLKAHPSYQVLMPSGKGPTRNPAKRLRLSSKKEPESPTKLKTPTLMDPMAVRGNAKKALYQILWKRCEGASDLSISQEEVEKIAHDVEEKLFNLHQDITPKYKNKYRSLVFNLKDMKNQGLFRKVLLQEISTRELVRMSTEKLASEDLAEWRQKTIKKNLEMIKVREEEEAKALAAGAMRKKTYKGDVEIETDPDSKIETIAVTTNNGNNNTTTDTETDSQTPTTASAPTPTPTTTKSQPRSKRTDSTSKGSPTPATSGGILDLLTNTTSQHGTHVFDHHCDICTGSKPPPSAEPVSSQVSPPSPDSRTTDIELMDTTETRSPDSVHPVPPVHADQEIWSGSINMAGLAKFATTAFPVSGCTEYLDQVLSSTLHVMGRIANVQVWDYVDKLRSSMTRDIVILRFEWVEEDRESYTSLLNYLVRKHRCAVIGSRNFLGIKDFYLVPLLENVDPAPQLLPFRGPGIPESHPAMLLGIIIRSKDQLVPPKKSKLSLMEPTIPANSTVDTISASVTLPYSHARRRHSASEEMAPQAKKSRLQIEVGIGDRTPPVTEGSDQKPEQQQQQPLAQDSGPSSPEMLPEADEAVTASTSVGGSSTGNVIPGLDFHPNPSASEDKKPATNTSAEVGSSQGVQLSFYGQHQEASASGSTSAAVPSSDPTSPPGGGGGIPSASGIQSILLQISDDKLKELASAMSSLNQGSPVSAAAAISSTTKGVTSIAQALASSTTSNSSSSALAGQQSAILSEQQRQMPSNSVQPLPTQGHTFSPTGQYPSQNQPGAQVPPPLPHREAQAVYQSGNYYNQGQQPQPPPHQQQAQQALQQQPGPGPQQYQALPPGPALQQVGSYSPNQLQQQYHPQAQQAYNYPSDDRPPQPQHMQMQQQQQRQQSSNYGPPQAIPGSFNQDPRNQYSGYSGGGQRVDDPQQNWEQGYRDRERYGDDFGHEHYDSRYDDASKLDRIESHDYGHQSGQPPADWRRHDRFQYEQDRGTRGHGGFRDRPRR